MTTPEFIPLTEAARGLRRQGKPAGSGKHQMLVKRLVRGQAARLPMPKDLEMYRSSLYRSARLLEIGVETWVGHLPSGEPDGYFYVALKDQS